MNRHLRGLRRLALATPLILVGLAHPAVAQRLPFRTFTEVDGAPSSAFGTGVQDSDGRLWVASRAGLAMYDGVEWTLEVDEAGMLHIALGAVQMDGAGRLWATVQATPPRVFRRDPDGWRQLPSPEPLASGWSSDLTVLAVEPVAEAPRCAIADLVNRVFIYAAGQWRRVDFAERDRVHAAAWHDGRLLVATAFGLKSVDCPADGPITVTELDGLPAGPAYAVIPPRGSLPLVVAGRGWLGTYDQGHYQPLAADARLALTVPYLGVSAVRDSVGGVWIGDRGTVVRWHPLLGLSLVEPAQGLPSAGTSGLLTDREGQVWIMNARGISVLADQRLETFDRTTGLFANEVSSIVLMPDGRAVLGHEGGLTFLDPAPSVLPIAGPDRSGRVMGACPDGRGGAWLACGRTGLVHLDSGHRAEIVVAPDEVTSWLSGVARTGDGTLWVSSHKGLHRLRGHRLEPVDLSPLPLAGEASLRRVLDVPGFGVVATSSRRGVVRVDGQGVHWMISTETAANSTFDVLDAGGGILWVGTGCGLRRIVDDAIVPMGPGDPVIDRPVYAITRGADGTVWFGTDAGVRTWDGHTLGALTPREGLRGAESNRDALKCDALGRIWIGTDRGLNIWDGRFAAPPLALPRARIEGFEVDGRPHAADVPLELAPSVRELRIHVRSDALRLGRQQRFQTRLVGYDPGWSEPHLLPDGVLRFTSLPAGRYHFEVRALAADGQPGPVAASPTMHVAQPLWRRPWLIAVNVAALLALAWLVSGGISARRYARRLQGEVKARTAELAASEQRLRHESHRLAVVLDSVGDGVIVVDTTGRITLGNPAAATLVGAAPGALDGRQLEDVLPGVTGLVREAAAAAVTGTSTFLGAGGTFRFQAAATKRDLDVAVAPLETFVDAGGSRVLALRDITGRRRSENERELLRRLESLAGLAGGIAHDFNNLLTIMQGYAAELRRGGRLSAADEANLGFIEGATAEARSLVGRLRAFARGNEPELAPVDIAALARSSAESLAVGDGLRLSLDLPSDLRRVMADRGQLAQVLGNLLLNARQAMPRGGGISVQGRNTLTAAGEPAVAIEIADEGTGIAPGDLDRVFDPYFTTKTDGTGMGLAIAHTIVMRHGGWLVVRSRPGEGTTFTLTLPAVTPGPGA